MPKYLVPESAAPVISMGIVCDRIVVKENATMPFSFEKSELEILLSKHSIVVGGVGGYDGLVTTISGEEQHLCGLQGYNPMLGDTCPGCDESRRNSRIMDAAKVYLREKGILSEYRL